MSKVALEPLFEALGKFLKSSDFEKAITQAEKILKVAPEDEDAFRALIVSLIHAGKPEEALSLLKDDDKTKKYAFEKAYCLYRTRDYTSCLSVLNSHFKTEKTNQVLQLESQLKYRLEAFQNAKEVISNLLLNSNDKWTTETKTNFAAAMASDPFTSEKTISSFILANRDEMEGNHDLVYNVASSFASIGDFSNALKYLQQAEDICRGNAEKDSDMTEEDLENELSSIFCQRAFVLQSQGKSEEATQLYNSLLKNKPSDDAVAAIANNNIVAVKKEGTDLFDSFKKLKQATSAALETKLTSTQKKIVGYNKCVILMHMNKGDQCRELLKSMEEQFPHEDRFPLVSSSLLFKEKKTAQSEELLRNFSAAHPDQSERVRLSLAQIHLNKGETREAIEILKSISQFQNRPGMVATLVSLHQQVGDLVGAVEILVNYTKQIQVKNLTEEQEDESKRNLQEISQFLTQHGRHKEAASVYEKILEIDSRDLNALSNLVIAYSHFDVKAAERFSNQLPTLNSGEEENINGEDLENMAAPKLSFKPQVQKDGEEPTTSEKAPAQKKKKPKKKKPLPKDLSKPVDPERWLPLVKRSYYKKKTKRGKMERGSQGNTTKQAAAGSIVVTASTPTPPPAVTPTVTLPPTSSKSKGKKRR